MWHHFKKLDWVLIVAAVLLVGIGLFSIYSSSIGREDFSNFNKQVIFFVAGILLMFLFSFFDWRFFRENTFLVLMVFLICLASLGGLFFFAPEIRGVKSWYKIGEFSIDPIEFIKIILIVLLAKYFSTRHVEMYQAKHIILSGLYVLVPAVLIFLQPNLGAVLILLFLWMGILIISGIKIRHFFILILCGLVIFMLSWGFLLKDYQKERIISFIIPADPLGADWSQNQAKIAIGSGGLIGEGMGSGSQTQYGFLPEPQTDFIFAAIAEETGLMGILVLFIIFSVLIFRIIEIAISSRTNFPRLFATGFAISLISEIFIHVGMNLGVLPIIGISLPFISYGGSSLISTFIGLGILQNIKANQ